MPRITKNTCSQTLQDTIAALITVREVYRKNRGENRREIDGISAAIRAIQNVLDVHSRKRAKVRTELSKVIQELDKKERTFRGNPSRTELMIEIVQLQNTKRELEARLKEK